MQDNKSIISLCIGNLVAVLIPVLCKWMTMMPQKVYIILAASFCVLSCMGLIVVSVLKRRQARSFMEKYQWPFYSLVLSAAFFLCTLIYPSIHVSDDISDLSYSARIRNLDSLTVKAENGNVNAMLMLGALYSQPTSSGVSDRDNSFIDYGQAEKYLEMAAEEGSADAYAILALMDYYGKGRRPSRKSAINALSNVFDIDPDNANILKGLRTLDVSEDEFPAGAGKIREMDERQRETERIQEIREEKRRERVNHILAELERMETLPIDSVSIRSFSLRVMPELEDVALDYPVLYDHLSRMCFYAGDHAKAFSFAQQYINRNKDDNYLENYRLLYTEHQSYGELMERLDTVFHWTNDEMLKQLISRQKELGLDDYYVYAAGLEYMKRMSESDDTVLESSRTLIANYPNSTSPFSYGLESMRRLKMDTRFLYDEGEYLMSFSIY